MMARVKILLVFVAYLFFYSPALALECGDSLPTSENELNEYISSCNSKISASKGTQATLSSAIKYLDNQISLAQAQIAATEVELNKLEIEITDLAGKISSLNYSLNDLTKIFISRVQATYKHSLRQSAFIALINRPTFAGLVAKHEYLESARDNDQKIMISLEKARLDYDLQKTLKEAKQKEVETLKSKLASQKTILANQKKEKDNLLLTTKNDEKKYQQLLADAQAQLAAFRTFVGAEGGATILTNTTKDDPGWGTYYNQRDSQWGNMMLGSSSISVADAGCLITSMAMVMSHYGKSTTPSQISSQPELFSFADFRLGTLNIAGHTTTRTRLVFSKSSARSVLDSELSSNPGKPVIVGIIQYGSSKPEHFLVVKAKVGDDYLINDPFPQNGHNLMFSSRYPLSSLTTVDRVTVN